MRLNNGQFSKQKLIIIFTILCSSICPFFASVDTTRYWVTGKCAGGVIPKIRIKTLPHPADNFQPFPCGKILPTCCANLQSTSGSVTSLKRGTEEQDIPSQSYFMTVNWSMIHLHHIVLKLATRLLKRPAL